MVRGLLAGTKTQTRQVVRPQFAADASVAEVSATTPEGWQTSGHSGLWWDDAAACIDDAIRCPYGQTGDRLWVKETFFAFGRWETRFSEKKGRDEWHFVDMTVETGRQYRYSMDDPDPVPPAEGRRTMASAVPSWHTRPFIFMPRAASRITLEVTGVRVERLQDISEADSIAEGLESMAEHGRDMRPTGRMQALNRWDDDEPHWDTPRQAYRALWEWINGPGSWDANPWVWCVSFRRIHG
jgi:hypothetical protein